MASSETADEHTTGHGPSRDLIVLVADGTMRATVKALLARPQALGIRSVDYFVVPHPERDPGVFHRAPEFLEPFHNRYRHALAMLDREGSGQELDLTREKIEEDLEGRLAEHWTHERCAAVALDPELEIWWWSDSPHVANVLGWTDRNADLRSWLVEEGYLDENDTKPARPKEAVQKALRIARKPRSSALYQQLAQKVSLRACQDPSFTRFRRVLQDWFPVVY